MRPLLNISQIRQSSHYLPQIGTEQRSKTRNKLLAHSFPEIPQNQYSHRLASMKCLQQSSNIGSTERPVRDRCIPLNDRESPRYRPADETDGGAPVGGGAEMASAAKQSSNTCPPTGSLAFASLQNPAGALLVPAHVPVEGQE